MGAIAAFLRSATALMACDNEAGQVCPMSIGKEVGECLQDPSKHQITDIDGNPRELEPGEKPLELSDGCKEFIKTNEACNSEIAEHCQGMYYHGDTMLCLTTWTQPEALSDKCKGSLPAKKEDGEDKVDAEKEAWRSQRKAARVQAQKDLEKEKKKTEKRRRRRKGTKEL